MIKYLRILILLFFPIITFGQIRMHLINELIITEDSSWSLVKEWISNAKNKVEVLPISNIEQAKDALYKTQVTTRSPMGTIVYMTGGILIDNGWIRILGSGSEKIKRSLPEWNRGKSFEEYGEPTSFFLIADDVIGGFYILNNGEFGKDLGKVYYFAPDTLEFEPLDLTYSDFLNFCFNGNLKSFYQDYRWKNWENDISKLNGDEVYNFFPYLWTKEGKNIENASKKVIQIEEQYHLNIDFRKQLKINND